MSREFGSYVSGYFHEQIQTGAEDCANGRDPLTRLWGKVLEAFEPVAYAISSVEAFDSGLERTVLESIEQIGNIKAAIADVEEYLAPFNAVAKEAVRRKLKEQEP